MSDTDDGIEDTVVWVTSSREGPAVTSSEQLERLRKAWVADIELLEKMGQEVITLRRRFREALQQLDVLIQRNADLEASVSAKDAVISAQNERIVALEAELVAILARRSS